MSGKNYQIFLLQKRVLWVMEYHQLIAQDHIAVKWVIVSLFLTNCLVD